MAAPLKSAKGKSLTVSFPRDGFFAPFRARWRDRRAADLSLETRTGKPAESRIPGGDPEPPPGPTLGNPGKSCFLLGFVRKFPEIPRILREVPRNSQDSPEFPRSSPVLSFSPRNSRIPQHIPKAFLFSGVFLFSQLLFLGVLQEFLRKSQKLPTIPRKILKSPGIPQPRAPSPSFSPAFLRLFCFSAENLLRKPGEIDGSAP